VPEKHGANLGAAEGQAEVAGGTSMHGVDREAACLIGCFSKEKRL
jgi:hypothetical protein